MKHILKVASLGNLPDTRPLIAMNDDGDLKCLAEVAPSIEMVDLGLSVKWAKANIGETCGDTAELWYGGFYAWGETETKSSYGLDTYKFGSSSPFSKYDKDGKTILDAVDDIATVEFGSNYRMPTKAEIEELIALPNQWVTNYNGVSGLNGRVFTGTNGNTLFIPATGNFILSRYWYPGEEGSLWSSSLKSDDPRHAYDLDFTKNVVSRYRNDRAEGRPVRAVCTAN